MKLIAKTIWNLSEWLNIGLGKYAPIIFGLMLDSKGHKIKPKPPEGEQ